MSLFLLFTFFLYILITIPCALFMGHKVVPQHYYWLVLFLPCALCRRAELQLLRAVSQLTVSLILLVQLFSGLSGPSWIHWNLVKAKFFFNQAGGRPAASPDSLVLNISNICKWPPITVQFSSMFSRVRCWRCPFFCRLEGKEQCYLSI